jgi:Spy/CpxP family protein refolding chaperone
VKRSYKAAGAVAALALGVAAAVFAQPAPADSSVDHGMGGGMNGGMGHMGHMGRDMAGGMHAGMDHGAMAGQQLMTPEERTALQAKMRSAKTPEERQKLAEATHTEMQKRAKAKGITLPDHHGPGAGFGPGSAGHMD